MKQCPEIYKREFLSPVGVLCLESDGERITALYRKREESPVKLQAEQEEPEVFAQTQAEQEESEVFAQAQAERKPPEIPVLVQAERELREYFEGRRQRFEVPVHLEGTAFQLEVWEALRQIPYGKTCTYSEIAGIVGRPKACRAIGGANNRNPVMILVPCHRVIGKDGSLVGFGGGLDMKQYLLELEQRTLRMENEDTEEGRMGEDRTIPVEVAEMEEGETDTAGMEEGEADTAGMEKAQAYRAGKERVQANPVGMEETQAGTAGQKENRSDTNDRRRGDNSGKVCEAALEYCTRRQGKYTLADYYALPKDRRVELIDGVLYDMAAPTIAHQMVSQELWSRLHQHVVSKQGNCLALMAPVDVQLDCDDRTMVQPDVLVVCDRDKLSNRCVQGAPDFVAEVVSDSSIRRDTLVKLVKYKAAGVQEYWIIDLKQQTVIVYDFAHDGKISVYGTDAEIPVGIFEGQCRILFGEIYAGIRFLLEPAKLQHFEEGQAGETGMR